MRTAILCYGPEFACTENLTKAFALRGDTQLVSAQEADHWRGYDAGLVLDSKENLEQARIVADAADLLVIGDAVSFCCLGRIGGIAGRSTMGKGGASWLNDSF